MTKQCPSCGGDCGHTKAGGCKQGAVVPGGFGRPVLTDLRNAIKDAIYAYDRRISLAEAIGLLEIVKNELIGEHQ